MDPSDSGKSILLVDDEPQMRDLASKSLRRHGYTVLAACDAAEALHISRTKVDFHILVTDVQMGDGRMDGFGLAALIMAERPGVPVVVMSGAGENKTLAATKGFAFLSKPFRPSALVDLVRAVERSGTI